MARTRTTLILCGVLLFGIVDARAQTVVGVDAADEFEPRARPRCLNLGDVLRQRFAPGQFDVRVDIDPTIRPAKLQDGVARR